MFIFKDGTSIHAVISPISFDNMLEAVGEYSPLLDGLKDDHTSIAKVVVDLPFAIHQRIRQVSVDTLRKCGVHFKNHCALLTICSS